MNDFADFSRLEPQLSRAASLIEIRSEGPHLYFCIGEASIRRSQWHTRGIGALAVAGGIGLLWFTIWGWMLIACGMLVGILGPRYVRSAKLIEIDRDAHQLVVVNPALGAGATVPIEAVRSIRGVFETKGWDGFNVLYATLQDGSETAVVMLSDTDERLAEHACAMLGQLLERPATYLGPGGTMKPCYTPGKQG